MARAVEIVAIGLGQAGGNIAAEFYRRGYRAMAFNTAATDLSGLSHPSTLLPEEARVNIGLHGVDGAGSDLSYGRTCIVQHAEQIREAVAAYTADADIVLLTAGLGGGTGSAICELIRVLAPLELPIVAMVTLPGEHESGIAKVNAVRAVNELVKQDVLGWLFYDNSRLAERHGDISLARYFPAINRLIVDPLDTLNNLNRRNDITPIRSLDGEDIRRLLLARGVMSFLTFSLPTITTEGMLDAVRTGLMQHTVQPRGLELEYVSYIGIVIEAPEAVLANTSFSTFEHIHEQLKRETGGASIHLGIYRVASRSVAATVRVFASSQALPDGLREIVGQAQREGKQLQTKLHRQMSGLELGDIESFELQRPNTGLQRRSPASDNDDPEASNAPRRPSSAPPPPPPLKNGRASQPPGALPPPLPPRAAVAAPTATAQTAQTPQLLGPLVSHSAGE